MCFVVALLLIYIQSVDSTWLVSLLFFSLGFFSSCQGLGFTWLIRNMKPALIRRNSAFNSMIFMSTNGGLKQLGTYLLSIPAIALGNGSSTNILLFVSAVMLVAAIYACIRKLIFKKIVC